MLDQVQVSVTADGTMQLWARAFGAAEAAASTLGLGDARFGARRPDFIDSKGTAWETSGGGMVGYRSGKAVHRYTEKISTNGNVVEDAHGRVWFAGAERVVWLDGEDWHERAVKLPSSGYGSSCLRLSSSNDGSRVYVWRKNASAFLDVCGIEPQFTLVDATRGLRDSVVWDLKPVGSSAVLTLPSYGVLHAKEWLDAESQVAPRLHVPHKSRFLGRYELSHHPSLLQSECGAVFLSARRATDWGDRAAAAEERRDDPGLDRSSANSVLPYGWNVMFRVTDRGDPQRVRPEQERFGTTYVDRAERHWRVGRDGQLSRLEGTRAFTLVDRKTNAPVEVWGALRSDRSGRVLMQSPQLGRLVWLPPEIAAGGLNRGSLGDDDFAWREVENRIWTPADEEAAIKLVRHAVEERDATGVAHLAGIFQAQGCSGAELQRGEVWTEASRWLVAPKPGPGSGHGWARVAHALGMRARAEAFLREALDSPHGDTAQSQAVALAELARYAEQEGYHHVAHLGYGRALEHPATGENSMLALLRASASHAVRTRRFQVAVERYDRLIPLARTWMKDDAVRERALIAELMDAGDDVEAHLAFIPAYFQSGNRARGRAEAWRYALANLGLTPSQRIRAHEDLLNLALQADDPAAARSEALIIEGTEDASPAAGAGALMRVACHVEQQGRVEEALRAYEEIYTRYAGEAAELGAKARAARIHLERNEARRGIELLGPCFMGHEAQPPGGQGSLTPKLHGPALLLSECYEAIGDLDQALRYARASQTKYPLRSSCGTCTMNEARTVSERIKRLERLR